MHHHIVMGIFNLRSNLVNSCDPSLKNSGYCWYKASGIQKVCFCNTSALLFPQEALFVNLNLV